MNNKKFEIIPVINTREILKYFIGSPVSITLTDQDQIVMGILRQISSDGKLCLIESLNTYNREMISCHIMNVQVELRSFQHFRFSDFFNLIELISTEQYLNNCQKINGQKNKDSISIEIRPLGDHCGTKYTLFRNWLLQEESTVNNSKEHFTVVHPSVVIHKVIELGFNPFC